MKFRIHSCWRLKELLPTTVECASTAEAMSQCSRFRRDGMTIVRIEAISDAGVEIISSYRLREFHRTEAKVGRRTARNSLACVVFGIVASALPNSFGDFGIVANSASSAAARRASAGFSRKFKSP